MFGGILYRMILWELTKVFTLSLVGITGIMLMGGIVAEATQQGLSPFQVLEAIPLLIPSFLPYTVPATTLFAACVVYGRLSHDNEILAIRSAGINLVHVLWPSLVIGVVMSAVTMGLYYRTIPYTHHLLRSMFIRDVEGVLYSYLKKDGEIKQPRLSYAIFVRRVEGRKLIGAIFKKRGENGLPEMVIAAKEAELKVDVEHRLVRVIMHNVEIYEKGGGRGVFMDKDEAVPLPDNFGDVYDPRPRDLTWQEILEQRRVTIQQISDTQDEIAAAEAGQLTQHAPENIPKHIEHLRYRVIFLQGKLFQLNAELQMRPALSLGCLFFVFIGCPVGIWFSRSDYLSAFMTCFLPIVFIYYPILLAGTNLAKEGRFIPALCIWAADGIMGLIGLLFFWRMLRN